MSSRVGRTTVVYFGTQVGSTLAGFLATWYINWALGSTVYGEYTIAVAFLFWLNVPASALGSAVNKRISEGADQNEFLAAGHLLNLAVHAALVAGLVLFRGQVNSFIGSEVGLLFAALVAARAVFDLTLASLRGYKQVGTSGGIKTLGKVARSGLQIGGLFLLGIGVGGLIVGHMAGLVLATGVGLWLLDGRPKQPSEEHVRGLTDYARYSWLGTLKTRAFAWTDVMVMRGLSLSVVGLAAVSKSQIGIYKVSWTVASMLALVSIAIKQTLFPELSDLGADENYERVHHFLNEGLAFTGVLAIPGLFGALAVGSDVLTIFGDEYATGGTILVILITARLLASFGSQFLNAINAIDRPDVAFRINLLYVLANVGLNVLLVVTFGWYGAAFATALSALISLVAGGYALTTLIGAPDVPVGELARQVVAGVVMLATVLGVERLLPETLAWTFVVVGIGAAVYCLVLVGISTRTREKAVSFLPVDHG